MDNKDGKEETVLALPMSRIKKIVKLDPEHISSTESANYVLGMATEMFVRQFAIDASEITKSKGRKKVMYADAQKAVSNVDIYSFMRDIVPKRAPIGELMSKGLIKLRPGDQQRMEESLVTEGYVDLEEADADGDDGEEADEAEVDEVEVLDTEEADGDGDGDGDVEMVEMDHREDSEEHDEEEEPVSAAQGEGETAKTEVEAEVEAEAEAEAEPSA